MLALLGADARISVATLARRLKVARSTIQARLERLETTGVIAGYTVKLGEAARQGRIRATVRAGRDQMRAQLLDWLPADLSGLRLLDAGCGTGALAVRPLSKDEVGIRLPGAEADRWLGTAYVGDAAKLATALKAAGVQVEETDAITGSLFARLDERPEVRFLIG